jgi:small subunit ribosomal protein S13
MLYIFETELPENKSIRFALMHVGGIGKTKSALICKNLGFSDNLIVKNLSKEHIGKVVSYTDSLNIDLSSDLRKFKLLIFKKLVSIKSYRGLRKSQGLPVRGQRTHTNAKTARKYR